MCVAPNVCTHCTAVLVPAVASSILALLCGLRWPLASAQLGLTLGHTLIHTQHSGHRDEGLVQTTAHTPHVHTSQWHSMAPLALLAGLLTLLGVGGEFERVLEVS